MVMLNEGDDDLADRSERRPKRGGRGWLPRPLGRCWTDAVQVATVGKPQVIQIPGTLSERSASSSDPHHCG